MRRKEYEINTNSQKVPILSFPQSFERESGSKYCEAISPIRAFGDDNNLLLKGRVWLSPTAALHDSKGIALVLTLMVTALITALVVEFSYGVYVNTSALYNWQALQKLSIAAGTGVRVAVLGITINDSRNSYTYPGVILKEGLKPFDDFEGSVSLRVEDEAGKLNINTIIYPNGMLNEEAYNAFIRLLKFLELDTSIADRVADWIDKDSEQRRTNSEEWTKNGPFESVDELLLVKGISRADYDKLAPYVTIYGDGRININAAQIPVLVSLADAVDKNLAERLVKYRELSPFNTSSDILKVAGFEMIGTSLMGRVVVKGKVFSVRSIAESGSLKRIIDCVLQVAGSGATIKYWIET